MNTCARCDHFTAKAASDATSAPVKDDLNAVGICRRYPPRLVAEGREFLPSRFPNVHPNHACGEFYREPLVI
jgi:hypothetical protein